VRFTRSHNYYCLVKQQKYIFIGGTHYQLWHDHRFARSSMLLVLSKLMNSGAWLHYSDRTSPVQCYALNRVRPNKIKKILLIYIFVINFLQFLIQLPLYCLFGIVAAGEVHPQPQLLLFGKAGKAHFYWWDPLPTVAQPPVCKKQHRCCFLC